MAVKTRAELAAQIAANFPDNNNKEITPAKQREYLTNELDSQSLLSEAVSANKTAVNDQSYTVLANATFTDPSPVAGKGFTVFVRNGIATVGGVAYNVLGTVIQRVFHSGSWANNVLLPQALGANIASGTTVNLANATGNSLSITGTTTITGFGTVQAGAIFNLTFTGILTLTHNATSLILPTGANITTAAGDVMQLVSLGSGNWKCTGYLRANGTPLVGVQSISGAAIDNTNPLAPVCTALPAAKGIVSFEPDGLTTDYVITHGFGFTPTLVTVQALNADAATIVLIGQYTSTYTSTDFTLTFLTAPLVLASPHTFGFVGYL
jgi:hypothetical protein